MAKKQLERLEDISLDNEDILFGVVKDGDAGLRLLFNEEVNNTDAKGKFFQENIGTMLGQIASENGNMPISSPRHSANA